MSISITYETWFNIYEICFGMKIDIIAKLCSQETGIESFYHVFSESQSYTNTLLKVLLNKDESDDKFESIFWNLNSI